MRKRKVVNTILELLKKPLMQLARVGWKTWVTLTMLTDMAQKDTIAPNAPQKDPLVPGTSEMNTKSKLKEGFFLGLGVGVGIQLVNSLYPFLYWTIQGWLYTQGKVG